jgi:hypothetical protein
MFKTLQLKLNYLLKVYKKYINRIVSVNLLMYSLLLDSNFRIVMGIFNLSSIKKQMGNTEGFAGSMSPGEE